MNDFLLQNVAFAIYIVTAFIFLGLAWLHWDAEYISKNKALQLRFGGFGLLALGFLLKIFSEIGIPMAAGSTLALALGSVLLALGIKSEPLLPDNLEALLKHPHRKVKEAKKASKPKSKKVNTVLPQWVLLLPLIPGLANAYTTFVIWRRYKKGKTTEYKPFVWGMGLLSVGLLLDATSYFGAGSIIALQQIFGQYEIIWIIQHILLGGAAISLLVWLWKYIKFRVHPELFITFAGAAIMISTFAAIFYSVSLYNNTENSVLEQLTKGSKTFEYAVSNLEDSALDTASLLAKTSDVQSYLAKSDLNKLYSTGLTYAAETESVDSIVFTDASAQVLVDTANESAVGNSLTDNELVIFALQEGQKASGVSTVTGVLGDDIAIEAVHPIMNSKGEVIGAVLTSVVIDDAFVDNIKRQTGLEAAVYVGNRRSATTLLSPDQLTRRENTVDNSIQLANAISTKETQAGVTSVINEDFHGAYTPLLGADQKVVGTLYVGQPESKLAEAVNNSLFTTFVASILVSLVALIPAYIIATRIEKGGY